MANSLIVSQVLWSVAYVGAAPRFVTLISSGKPRAGTASPRGALSTSPRTTPRFLFDFTAPALPPGYHAIRPTPRDPGTLVVLR